MPWRFPSPVINALIAIPAIVGVLVILFFIGRELLHLGPPPAPLSQGAGIAFPRGRGIFHLYHQLTARTSEVVGVTDDEQVVRGEIIDGVELNSSAAPIRPAFLQDVLQFQKAWCHNIALPPTPVPTVSSYRLTLNCSAFGGRVFYLTREQLPAVLLAALQEAPQLSYPSPRQEVPSSSYPYPGQEVSPPPYPSSSS
jgi:hypothetical protein